MKVSHVTISVSSEGGGIATVLHDLTGALSICGIEQDCHSLMDDGNAIHGNGSAEYQTGDSNRIGFYQHPISRRWPIRQSASLVRTLTSDTSAVIHSHGLWTDCSRAVNAARERRNVPVVVSPHGMLDPWALRRSRTKKAVAKLWFENEHLRKATIIHALCEAESEAIRNYGINVPIVVIPNGVYLPEPGLNYQRVQSEGQRKRMLFLGRIHPKKGLSELIQAWSANLINQRTVHQADRMNWQLVIAGWDQGGYRLQLEEMARDLGMSVEVANVESDDFKSIDESGCSEQQRACDLLFAGPAFGEKKKQLLTSAEAFVLPSHSEGLPVAVLEAWSFGLPVLMTTNCNLPIGFTTNSAWRLSLGNPKSNESLALARQLNEFFELSDRDRTSLGENGRRLVESDFTWSKVASDLMEVYMWAVNDTPPRNVMIR